MGTHSPVGKLVVRVVLPPSTAASLWKRDCSLGELQPLVRDQGMESLLPQSSLCCLCKVYLTLKLWGLLRAKAQGLEKAEPSACPLLAALQAPSSPISLLHRPLEKREKPNPGCIFRGNLTFFFSPSYKRAIEVEGRQKQADVPK